MFNELNQFNSKKQEYENQLQQLEREREELINRHKELLAKHDEEIEKDLFGKPSDIKAVRDELDDVERQLEVADKKIELLRQKMQEELSAMLTEVKRGRDRFIAEVHKRFYEATKELKRLRALYMIAVKRLHDIHAEAATAAHSYLEAARIVGVDASRDFVRMPTINFYGMYEGPKHCHGILQHEVMQTLNHGTLPAWINDYLEEGIITESDLQ